MRSKLLKKETGGIEWSLMDIVVNALTAFMVIFMLFLLIPKEDLVDELIRRGQTKIEQALKQNVRNSIAYEVEYDGHRQIIKLGSNVLFPIFGYKLQESGRRILREIATVLEIYQGKIFDPDSLIGYFSTISIDGHTDSLTVLKREGAITSNWHLSSLRAISVLEFLDSCRVDAKRMSATGYASTRPAKPDSLDNNGVNATHMSTYDFTLIRLEETDSLYRHRRVEITLVYSPEEIRAAVRKHFNKSKENH